MSADCIFCKIANGEIPAKTIYEDADFRVILDIAPGTPGHALILPKSHGEDLFSLECFRRFFLWQKEWRRRLCRRRGRRAAISYRITVK